MNISINPEELKKIANQINENAESYKKSIQKIYENVDGVNSSWAGKDSQQYIQKVNTYKESMLSLGKVIENYAQFLTGVANQYQKAQQEIADALR